MPFDISRRVTHPTPYLGVCTGQQNLISQSPPEDYFEQLPDGPKNLILQQLNGRSLQAMRCTNKNFGALGKNHRLQGNHELFQQNLRHLPKKQLLSFLSAPKSREILQSICTSDLSQKELTADDLNAILSILAELESNNIRELNLGTNNISADCARAIAESAANDHDLVAKSGYDFGGCLRPIMLVFG